jgi:hypothetical protein
MYDGTTGKKTCVNRSLDYEINMHSFTLIKMTKVSYVDHLENYIVV